MACNNEVLRPFLRWAGGKHWLTNFIRTITDELGYNKYFEPFLGGGATFFALCPQKANLSDKNAQLINSYTVLRDNPEEVILLLKTFRNDSKNYYKIRETISNDAIFMCARFLYLNQTSFNGLYRVNSKGKYNVPYGKREIDFIREERLRKISHILQSAEITYGDFEIHKDNIEEKDLVFLDPPYTVSHNQNGFIKYNQELFSLEDQYRLSKFMDHIKSKDAYYILTNAAHSRIKEIFFREEDTILTLKRHNTIGGKQAKRGHVEEYVFTNIKGA